MASSGGVGPHLECCVKGLRRRDPDDRLLQHPRASARRQDLLGTLRQGDILLADRAYDSDALRQTLAARGTWANIKPMPGRKNIPAFSPFLYRYRNLVERFFNKLKHYRAVATRYDKSPDNYLAAVKLASARIWMRFNESMA